MRDDRSEKNLFSIRNTAFFVTFVPVLAFSKEKKRLLRGYRKIKNFKQNEKRHIRELIYFVSVPIRVQAEYVVQYEPVVPCRGYEHTEFSEWMRSYPTGPYVGVYRIT